MRAAKGRISAFFFAAIALLACAPAFASIPRSSALDPPAIDRFDLAEESNDVLPLHDQLARAAIASWPIETLPETRVGVSEIFTPLEHPQQSELSRALHHAYAHLSGENASDQTFAGGDPVNRRDPTGLMDGGDTREDFRRKEKEQQEAEYRARVKAEDAADRTLHDELQRFGNARMQQLRAQGINVRARDVVAITPDGLSAITADGRLIPNPYAGRVEDQTTDLVLTVAGLKVASPVIANAFRTCGLRAGALAVADEAVAQTVGIAPSAPFKVARSIKNALDAQRALAEITERVNAQLAADPSLAKTVLTFNEYQAATLSARVAKMQYGNAVERLVAREIEKDPALRQVFQRVGGPNNPDFTAFGQNYDVTTETMSQVSAHMRRPGYGQGLGVVTYQRSPTLTTFPQ